MPPNNNKSQSGNVFVIILIGIILFAALLYTFTKSTQTGTGNLSEQQEKIAVTEILNYARIIESAVDRVRQNGCSENEISFEDNNLTGYVNGNGPADNSCRIFNTNGGQAIYEKPLAQWLDNSFSASDSFGDYYFTTACVRGLGKDSGSTNENQFCNSPNNNGEELIFVLPYLDQSICIEINKRLYNDPTIFIDATARYAMNENFDGNYTSINEIANATNDFENKNSFCFNSANAANQYDFYHVIFTR